MNLLKSQILSLEAFMRALGSRDDWCITDQGIVDSGIRNQVGLELVQVDIQSAIESERRSNGANNLGNQSVKVLEGWPRNIQISTTDIVDGFVVNQKRTVRIFDGAVCAQNCVVRLYNGSGDSWGRVNSEFKLGLLAIVGGQTFQKEGSKTRTSSTAKGVEDQETLEGRAVIL